MTLKIKAIELFGKYYDTITPCNNSTPLTRTMQAKECAFIAIDEILKVCEFHKLIAEKEWWQEVKQEIQNL